MAILAPASVSKDPLPSSSSALTPLRSSTVSLFLFFIFSGSLYALFCSEFTDLLLIAADLWPQVQI